MAKPVWQQRLQDKLNSNPLCFVGDTHLVKHVSCLKQGESKGKKVTLRLAVNFSFNTCAECKVSVR